MLVYFCLLKMEQKIWKNVPLFVGRFQPFHKGHLRVVLEALKKWPRILVGIGSSNLKKADLQNPLDFVERKFVLMNSLKNLLSQGKVKIVGIPDLPSDSQWRDWIEQKFSPSTIISGNERIKDIFGSKVEFLPSRFKNISATQIRQYFIKGEIQKAAAKVPKFDILQKLRFAQRLQHLLHKGELPFDVLKKKVF